MFAFLKCAVNFIPKQKCAIFLTLFTPESLTGSYIPLYVHLHHSPLPQQHLATLCCGCSHCFWCVVYCSLTLCLRSYAANAPTAIRIGEILFTLLFIRYLNVLSNGVKQLRTDCCVERYVFVNEVVVLLLCFAYLELCFH